MSASPYRPPASGPLLTTDPTLRPGSPARRAIRGSMGDAVVASLLFAATEMWLVPLIAERLHGGTAHVFWLNTLPFIGLIFTGLFGQTLVEFFGGHKRCCITANLVQIVCIAGLLPTIIWPQAAASLPAAMVFGVLFAVMGGIGGVGWLTWLGQVVPGRLMGRTNAMRMRLFFGCKMVLMLVYMAIMHHWPPAQTATGLLLVFSSAIVGRVASSLYMAGMPASSGRVVRHRSSGWTEMGTSAQTRQGLIAFVRNIARTAVGRWTLVWAALHIGLMTAGPYFGLYLLTDEQRGAGLGNGNMWYTLLLSISSVVRIVFYPLMGRLVERWSPAAMLRFGVIGIVIVPLGWALSTSLWWIVAAEVMSGICWAAAEAAVLTLLMTSHSDPAIRARLIGYHQVVTALGILLGLGLGWLLLELITHGVLPMVAGSEFRAVFLFSCLMRLPALLLAFVFLPPLPALGRDDLAMVLRHLPGSGPVIVLHRGLMRFFSRPGG